MTKRARLLLPAIKETTLAKRADGKRAMANLKYRLRNVACLQSPTLYVYVLGNCTLAIRLCARQFSYLQGFIRGGGALPPNAPPNSSCLQTVSVYIAIAIKVMHKIQCKRGLTYTRSLIC